MQRLKPFVMLILASLVASAARPLTHENVDPSLRTPLDYTEAELLNKTCTPRDSYTNLTFDNAHLVLSNLGGQGGRCVDTCYTDPVRCFTWNEFCDEQQPTANAPDAGGVMGNMHILFRDVGTVNGQSIWLRITNESEYRAWNPRHNGVKRQDGKRKPRRAHKPRTIYYFILTI